MEPTQKQSLQDLLPPAFGESLIVFTDGAEVRTVLTDRVLVGWTTGSRFHLALQDAGDYEVESEAAGEWSKETSNCVRFAGFADRFWTPDAEQLSRLLNTMQIVFNANRR